MYFYKDYNHKIKPLKWNIGKNFIKVEGSKGVLSKRKNTNIIIIQKKDNFYFFFKQIKNLNKKHKQQLLIILKRFRKLMLLIRYGFIIKLRFVGIGYKMDFNPEKSLLELKLGYSHPIEFIIPKHVFVNSLKTNKNLYTIFSIYPDAVQKLAYKIRNLRKPEPYKGKGIRYQGEYVRRKEGKKNAN